jgi:hypothetical protein
MLSISSYLFLLAAVVVWPIIVPLSILKMERSKNKRRLIKIFLITGIFVSLYYSIGLLIYNVDPEISNHHIKYTNSFPKGLAKPVFIMYLHATLGPIFLSSVRRMWIFGLLVTLSCIITAIFFREYLTSVWCFFAAFISVIIYLIVRDGNNESVSNLHLDEPVSGKLFNV